MVALTARQSEILTWIADFTRDRGYSPTRREVAKHFGYADQTGINVHIFGLRRKGRLDWNRCQPRTFVVLEAV